MQKQLGMLNGWDSSGADRRRRPDQRDALGHFGEPVTRARVVERESNIGCQIQHEPARERVPGRSGDHGLGIQEDALHRGHERPCGGAQVLFGKRRQAFEIEPGAEAARPSKQHDGRGVLRVLDGVEHVVQLIAPGALDRIQLAIVHADDRDPSLDLAT